VLHQQLGLHAQQRVPAGMACVCMSRTTSLDACCCLCMAFFSLQCLQNQVFYACRLCIPLLCSRCAVFDKLAVTEYSPAGPSMLLLQPLV
jgi:hypothetical protein